MDIGNPPQPRGKRAGSGAGDGTAARGAHWISLSARDDAEPFGAARGGETVLNARGKALAAAWRELGELREGIEPDAVRIGPRSLEGILLHPARKTGGEALGGLVRLFKVMSSLRLAHMGKTAALRNTPVTGGKPALKSPAPLWKKGYSEKALDDAAALAGARKALQRKQAR